MSTSPSPAAEQPVNLVHRWPWTASEIISAAITATVVAGVILRIRDQTTGNDTAWGVAAALGALLVVAWLHRVKTSRVRRSQINVTINGTHIRIHQDGPVGSTAVDAAKVRTIAHRTFGSDECLILSDGTQAARIPRRTMSLPQVRTLVTEAYESAEAVDPNAAAFVANLPGRRTAHH